MHLLRTDFILQHSLSGLHPLFEKSSNSLETFLSQFPPDNATRIATPSMRCQAYPDRPCEDTSRRYQYETL